MKITLLGTKEIEEKLNEYILSFDKFYWAIAWGSCCPLADKLFDTREKIAKIVIGVDFVQTDPDLLEVLAEDNRTRIASSDSANHTFHPKVYYFQTDKNAAAIIGSANFTNGGTKNNTEAALSLEGSRNDEVLISIKEMVESFWGNGKDISKEFLTEYKKKHKNRNPQKETNRAYSHPNPKKSFCVKEIARELENFMERLSFSNKRM